MLLEVASRCAPSCQPDVFGYLGEKGAEMKNWQWTCACLSGLAWRHPLVSIALHLVLPTRLLGYSKSPRIDPQRILGRFVLAGSIL